MKLGIDFGTSFSLPAAVYMDSQVVLLPSGKYGIPSVFYYNDWEGVLVGEEAEDAGQGDEAKNLKREVKLELGSSFTADGRTFSAREIVGYILAKVVDTALTIAKTKLIEEPLEGVVISVPAAFEHNEKEFIRAAAEIPREEGGPGLTVLGFIKEPVAAALAYFQASLEDNTKVLVYDLGGGTCDVAVVEARSDVKEKYVVLESDMLRIGGKDWDGRLETYILRELEKQTGSVLSTNKAFKEKAKRAAISAKHAFSEKTGDHYRDKVTAKVEVNGRLYRIQITKTLFDELTGELLNETIQMTKRLVEKESCSGVKRLVCVGGSSNMPQVLAGLAGAFPEMEIQIFEPEKSIACGAAIYAQSCDIVSDIAAYSYGIRCYQDYDKDPVKKIIVNLIKKGDRLPKTGEYNFSTIEDDMGTSSFKVFESAVTEDECAPEAVPAEHILEVVLDLPEGTPKGTSVTAKMTLTTDGLIEVIADDKNGHISKGRKKLNF